MCVNKLQFNPIYMQQKKALKIINEPTTSLFVKLHTLNFFINLNAILTKHKAQNNLNLKCIQRLFEIRE